MSPDTIERPRIAGIDGAPEAPAAPLGGDIVGYIDVISGRRVAGWIWDPDRPDRKFDVEISFDHNPVATVRADRPRKDLAGAGIGDGAYGWEAQLSAAVADSDRRRVTAAVRNGSENFDLRNVTPLPPGDAAAAAAEIDALRAVIDSWPDRMRAQQKGLFQNLQSIGVELRRLREAVDAGRKNEPDGSLTEAIAELRKVQDGLLERVGEIDVFHARFDLALQALERSREARETRAAPQDNRGMRRIVVALSLVSGTSLVLGLVSILS